MVFFTKGIAQVTVECKGIQKNLRVFVVEQDYSLLLGCE